MTLCWQKCSMPSGPFSGPMPEFWPSGVEPEEIQHFVRQTLTSVLLPMGYTLDS